MVNIDEEPEETRIERHASWAELFFDLVAVLFLALWLAWTTFMLYGNVAAGRASVLRLMVAMFGLSVVYGYAGLPHLRAGGIPTRAALGLQASRPRSCSVCSPPL
ncbi:hypothetical protein [Actinoplanes auranticolor]|uniref:Uncharacterized protein n=1 Tax=Actinoplanes auranticolor TaxID=47988 RepID=A0A919T083_9ACTN|nr:hypothetical protein [Actinoplanes auranticolor]GIM80453.1 hypothetical protein Aau02nite_90630 [Actinoplanes auranticolor]